MSDSIASAAAREIYVKACACFEDDFSEDKAREIIQRALSSHTQALQGQVEELRKALKELIAYLDSMSDFDHQPDPLANARSILAAHRGETK